MEYEVARLQSELDSYKRGSLRGSADSSDSKNGSKPPSPASVAQEERKTLSVSDDEAKSLKEELARTKQMLAKYEVEKL